MASQNHSSVPFSFNQNQQNYRLLELPSALLELIISPNPPILSLKSTSTTAANASPAAAPNAVLCTDDRTFQLRQVHSSNSIFLLQPLEATSSPGNGSTSVPGVSAIAQCKATLELMPVATSAVQYLKESVPIYKDPLEGESFATSEIGRTRSKLVVLEDAPMSTGEFESGWIELCAFETEGQAWRPLTSTLNGIWKSILSAVAVNAPKIDNGFPTFLISPLVQEDGYSESLLMAVLTRLSPNGDFPSHDWAVIDSNKCLRWVGAVLLESQPQRHEGTPKSHFLQSWKDQMPEVWRDHANLGLLEGKYIQLSNGSIVFNEVARATADAKPAVSADVSARGARKWHEKFKNTRR